MGCGASNEKKEPEEPYRKDENAPSEEADPDEMDAITRKDSVAVKTSEPSTFVVEMRTKYRVTKAKYVHGVNDDVDQYDSEIRQSFPHVSTRDKARVKQWAEEVCDATGDEGPEPLPEGFYFPKARRNASDGDDNNSGNENADGDAQEDPGDPASPAGANRTNSDSAMQRAVSDLSGTSGAAADSSTGGGDAAAKDPSVPQLLVVEGSVHSVVAADDKDESMEGKAALGAPATPFGVTPALSTLDPGDVSDRFQLTDSASRHSSRDEVNAGVDQELNFGTAS